MEFLKGVLNDELFEQVSAAIEAHNSDEANGGNQIKLANLATGNYVNKNKYQSEVDSLSSQLQGRDSELTDAKTLIEQLQKASEGHEDMQSRFESCEAENKQLKAEIEQIRVDAEVKVGLIAEKANDVEYVAFVLKQKMQREGKKMELDDRGRIKGWDSIVKEIKAQLPAMFTEQSSERQYEEKVLEKSRTMSAGLTKTQLMKMSYKERCAVHQQNPELYRYLMQG